MRTLLCCFTAAVFFLLFGLNGIAMSDSSHIICDQGDDLLSEQELKYIDNLKQIKKESIKDKNDELNPKDIKILSLSEREVNYVNKIKKESIKDKNDELNPKDIKILSLLYDWIEKDPSRIERGHKSIQSLFYFLIDKNNVEYLLGEESMYEKSSNLIKSLNILLKL